MTRPGPLPVSAILLPVAKVAADRNDDPDFVAETRKIHRNREKPENQQPHDFVPARWTHPNGHPRCLRCGDEEPVGGRCAGYDPDRHRPRYERAGATRERRIEKHNRRVAREHNPKIRAFGRRYGLDVSDILLPVKEARERRTKETIEADGLTIRIEYRKGDVRTGTDADGKAWSRTMEDAYGRVADTKGADGEALDCYVGTAPLGAGRSDVYVVNQVDPDTGAFDEHKVMLGYGSEAEARRAYLRNYPAGWTGLGSLKTLDHDGFRAWCAAGERRKAAAVAPPALVDAVLAHERALADEVPAPPVALPPPPAPIVITPKSSPPPLPAPQVFDDATISALIHEELEPDGDPFPPPPPKVAAALRVPANNAALVTALLPSRPAATVAPPRRRRRLLPPQDLLEAQQEAADVASLIPLLRARRAALRARPVPVVVPSPRPAPAVAKVADYAPGLPRRGNFGDLSRLQQGQLLDYVIQHHRAHKAGPHYDVRLGTRPTGMYSWAARKGVPVPGEKHLAVRQPLHRHAYNTFEGEIPRGYGAGTVKTHDIGQVLVTKVGPDHIHFTTAHRRHPERFVLMRPRGFGRPDHWLLTNVTPTERVPFEKLRYRRVPADQVENAIRQMGAGGTVEAKVDGASQLVHLVKGHAEHLSFRTSKETNRPIIHTERVFGGRPTFPYPKHLEGSVLKGELYASPRADDRRNDGMGSGAGANNAGHNPAALGPQDVGTLLNSSVARSLQLQREQGIKIRNMLYDVQRYGRTPVDPAVTPRPERRRMLEEILGHLPSDTFHASEPVADPEKGVEMYRRIAAGTDPMTREGVVIHPATGIPLKGKLTDEYDVYVTGTFPGEGKRQHTFGGFTYGHEPGKTVGRVGSGFSDAFLTEAARDPAAYVGRVARIKAQEKLPSGALRAPVFLGLHEDVNRPAPPGPVAKAAGLTPGMLAAALKLPDTYGPEHKPSWTKHVMTHYDSTKPPRGIFTRSADEIAAAARDPHVAPGGPASWQRMVVFHRNRGGARLGAERRAVLQEAIQQLSEEIRRQKHAAARCTNSGAGDSPDNQHVPVGDPGGAGRRDLGGGPDPARCALPALERDGPLGPGPGGSRTGGPPPGPVREGGRDPARGLVDGMLRGLEGGPGGTKFAALLPGVRLQPQQERVRDRVNARDNRLLIMHGLGSGKSLASLAAAEAAGAPYTAAVPAALRPNYNKEIAKFTDARTPHDVLSYTQVGMGRLPAQRPGTLILDEAQRLRNPNSAATRGVKELARQADRVMLLSGTPIVNQPNDLAVPLSILTGQDVDPREFNRRFVGQEEVSPGFGGWLRGVKPVTVPALQHEDELEGMLRGHVDYHPSKTPEGVNTNEERVVVDMSPQQKDFYRLMWNKLPWLTRWKMKNDYPMTAAELKNLQSFLTGPRQAALSLYPFQGQKDPYRAFQESAKLQAAFKSMQSTLASNPQAKVLAYSNFIDAGLTPYEAALKAHGIPYSILHGKLNDAERKAQLDAYNTGTSRVLLLGPSAAEGISARGTQLIQLLDPHWNEARMGQAQGRGLRFDSHEGLPEELRNVKIQRYIARMPDPGFFGRLLGGGRRPSADEFLEAQARRKEELNEQFRDVLRRVGSEPPTRPWWSLFS